MFPFPTDRLFSSNFYQILKFDSFVFYSIQIQLIQIFNTIFGLQIYCSWYFKRSIFDFLSSFLKCKEKILKIIINCYKSENNISPSLVQNRFIK